MGRAWAVLVISALAVRASGASAPPQPRRRLDGALVDAQPSRPALNRAAIHAMERRLDRDLEHIALDSHAPTRVELALRALALALVFAPVLCTAPFAAMSAWFCRVYWYGLLARTLGAAGVAFIKWAQWASTRTDLLPEALCHELGALRYSAPRHSARHSRRLVERAVGLALESYFESFELRPIASGSIAQVHAATLHGLAVAVKVRHPRVVERIATDFTLMECFAALVSSLGLLRWFDLEETVRQFSAVIGAQTQLQTEALHLRLCRRNFARWPDCVFPRPLLATAEVLIETFEPGRHVSDWTDPPRGAPASAAPTAAAPATAAHAAERRLLLEPPAQAQRGASERALAPAAPPPGEACLSVSSAHFVVTRGEDVYLKMLLQDNLMHADLHPGNILLREAERRVRADRPSAIVFVDLGMVAILTVEEREHFLGLLVAMGHGDGRAAAGHVLAFAAEQPNADADAFTAEMGALFERACRGYGTAPDFGEVVRGILAAVRTHRVRLGSNYMTLIINALCLDAMARKLQPSYNVLDASKPLLELHARTPRRLFSLLLPVARFVKARIDARHLRRLVRSRH